MSLGIAYYNEYDEYAAAWLVNLINAGHIAPGIVDTRSIVDVQPEDLRLEYAISQLRVAREESRKDKPNER